MSNIIESPVDENIRERFINVVRSSNILDEETNQIHLNTIWFEPNKRKEFSRVMTDFLVTLPNRTEATVLLYPEGLLSTFGILPIVSISAHELGHRLAIWREVGNIVTTKPKIFPDYPPLPRGIECIVLQDVVSRGTTLRKMQKLMLEISWNIVYYIAVIEIKTGRNDILESINECRQILSQNFQYKFILSDTDLRRV